MRIRVAYSYKYKGFMQDAPGHFGVCSFEEGEFETPEEGERQLQAHAEWTRSFGHTVEVLPPGALDTIE